MPDYTIETTYQLPVYRKRSYSAETPEEACQAAIKDDDWNDDRHDYEASGETYVTGIWEGENAAYRGATVPVPSSYPGTVQRKLGHFEILLGLLKMILTDVLVRRPTSKEWTARASWAVARGEAIIAASADPEPPPPFPDGEPGNNQKLAPDGGNSEV
jgi:hypothetical protein